MQPLVMGPQVHQHPDRAVDRGDKSGFGGDGPQLRYGDRAFNRAPRPILIAAADTACAP